jgi:spoIIIJ-associated protein
MRSVEVSAKTLEEAKLEAARQLGVSVDALSVEVIEEPRRILGLIGGGEYRIKATAEDSAEIAPHVVADDIYAAAPEAAEPAPSAEPAVPAAAPVSVAASEARPAGGDDLTAVAEKAREILQDIVDLMGLPGAAEIVGAEGRDVFLQVNGDDLGALIGRHGATLDALQLLVSVAANNVYNVGARIIVDAEEYRERRRQMLEKMALAEADKVKRTQRELVIPDLKPYERRIVHMVLKDDPDVETYSEGEGEQRQLVITPRG